MCALDGIGKRQRTGAVQNPSRVNDLAPLLVRSEDFARTGLPRTVGWDDFYRAIRVGDFKLGGESGTGPILGQPHPAKPPGIPAIAQHNAERIFSRAKQSRYIECLDHDPLVVIGPAGIEQVVAYSMAIDGGLIDAQSSGVKPGLADGCIGGKELPHISATNRGVV